MPEIDADTVKHETKARVLIVDDEEDFLEICSEALERTGADITVTVSPREALRRVAAEKYDLVFADQKMPEMDGLEFLERAVATDPALGVVLFTGYPTVESAVQALRIGAKDYLTKPFSGAQLRAVMHRVLSLSGSEQDRSTKSPGEPPAGLVAESGAMKAILEVVDRVAELISTVFITGETGTGKGVLARVIHERSQRRRRRFQAVNCGALPTSLLEAELFGHERGAFTGATRSRLGLIESSEGGTLFLDEVTELPVELQSRLLDVLQTRRVRPVGSSDTHPVDFRLIAATNRVPEEEVRAGKLREDLYFRLNVVRIDVPPLRERQEDISRLAQQFVDELRYTSSGRVEGIGPEAVASLLAHQWPGNVRELRNVIERSMPLAAGPLLMPADLAALGPSASTKTQAAGTDTFTAQRDAAISSFERGYIETLLHRAGGNVSQACRLANVPRNTFYRYLHKYGIRPEEYKRPP